MFACGKSTGDPFQGTLGWPYSLCSIGVGFVSQQKRIVPQSLLLHWTEKSVSEATSSCESRGAGGVCSVVQGPGEMPAFACAHCLPSPPVQAPAYVRECARLHYLGSRAHASKVRTADEWLPTGKGQVLGGKRVTPKDRICPESGGGFGVSRSLGKLPWDHGSGSPG